MTVLENLDNKFEDLNFDEVSRFYIIKEMLWVIIPALAVIYLFIIGLFDPSLPDTSIKAALLASHILLIYQNYTTYSSAIRDFGYSKVRLALLLSTFVSIALSLFWVLRVSGGILLLENIFAYGPAFLITLVLIYSQSNLKEVKFIMYQIKNNSLVLVGIGILTVLFYLAIMAPLLTPFKGTSIFPSEDFIPPNAKHLFGSNHLGADVFSRCLWALGLDLRIAITVVGVAVIIGITLGGIAGYYGGMVDEIIMRITDIFMSFPGLVLAMAVAAALGPGLTNLAIALIIVWWSGYVRLIRAQILTERERLYIEAARAVGASGPRVIYKHLLPNSFYPILVSATMDLGSVILTTAALSFIGFGADPTTPELGRMIASGTDKLQIYPWLVFFPGLFIFLITLGFNLVGDGLRDVLDPRIRR